MAHYNDNIIDIELTSGSVHRSHINHILGMGDIEGNKYGIRVFRNGNPENLSGSGCVGYFIRPNGTTLVISGTVSGNTAYVTLPESAYIHEGQFSLAIKIAGTGFAETIRIIDGVVVRTTTDTLVDPAHEIPSIEELMEVISRIETAAATIEGISISSQNITGTRYKIKVTKE